MTTEGPLQIAGGNGFSKNHIPTQQQSLYSSQREHFPESSTSEQQQQTQQQPPQSQAGSLMRGYSFLADQIYRSVSNPLYKLVRTVEDTVGGDYAGKQSEEAFHNGYQEYQSSTNLKFESNANFEAENVGKMTEQQETSSHQMHRQHNFNVWEANNAIGVQQWYPRLGGDVQPGPTETYPGNSTWPIAHGAHSETSKSATPPPQSASPGKAASVFQQQQQSQQSRYHQPYFQEWAEGNHSTANAVPNAPTYYPQQHFDGSVGTPGTSASPQINEEVSFPNAGSSTAEASSSCPGCCVPPAATPHQTSSYSDTGTELHNGLCLVDPMRALPRYLTTGLWPPVISPAKLEWSGGSGVGEDDARLLDMNRFYAEGGYRMTGGAAAAAAAANVYQGYAGSVQDTKDFFFTPSRYSTGGDAVFRHKAEAHRLSVAAAAVTAVDCDPQELEAFAERFKQRRIKLGVTQADVGKALGRLNLAGAWLDEAEQEAAARQKNPNAYDMEEDDKKRKRTSITDPEKRSLEAFFGIQPRPSSEKIAQIAEKLNLKKNVVRVWFCNQRQKQKRMKFSTVGLLHPVNGM